jgi:hypothetical protein
MKLNPTPFLLGMVLNPARFVLDPYWSSSKGRWPSKIWGELRRVATIIGGWRRQHEIWYSLDQMKETPLLGMERGVGRRERWRPGVLYGIDGEGGEEWRGRKWMPQGVSPKCLRGGKYRERSALSCTIWRLSREFSDLQKLVCFHVICSVSRYAWDQWRTYRENIGRAKLKQNTKNSNCKTCIFVGN